MTVEQIAEAALSLPSEARALLADRLVESLDPAEDGFARQLWAAEAIRRRDDVRGGRVQTIPVGEGLARVRRCREALSGSIIAARRIAEPQPNGRAR